MQWLRTTATFRQSCKAEPTGQLELPDVNYCTTTEDDVRFLTKDFVKPTAEERQFINSKSHHSAIRLRKLNQMKEDNLASPN